MLDGVGQAGADRRLISPASSSSLNERPLLLASILLGLAKGSRVDCHGVWLR